MIDKTIDNIFIWVPGGTHMKGVGMLVGNFELNPLKETSLGVAQPFFWPLKAIILNFDYMNR